MSSIRTHVLWTIFVAIWLPYVLLLKSVFCANITTSMDGEGLYSPSDTVEALLTCKIASSDCLPEGTSVSKELFSQYEAVPIKRAKNSLPLCTTMYEYGWTCRNGAFDRDLLAYTITETDDCELRSALGELEGDFDEVMRLLDGDCAGMSGKVRTLPLDLNTLMVRSNVSEGSLLPKFMCEMDRAKLLFDWRSNDCYGNGLGDPEDMSEWTCAPTLVPFEMPKGLCINTYTVKELCALAKTDGFNEEELEDECALRELRDSYYGDASMPLVEACTMAKRRRLPDYSSCPTARYFYLEEMRFHRQQSTVDFHFHYRNVLDVRWLTRDPTEWGRTGCGLTTPYRSKWNRVVWSTTPSSSKDGNFWVVGCHPASAANDKPHKRVIGSFKGYVRIYNAQLDPDASSVCNAWEGGGYVHINPYTSLQYCSITVRDIPFDMSLTTGLSYRECTMCPTSPLCQ